MVKEVRRDYRVSDHMDTHSGKPLTIFLGTEEYGGAGGAVAHLRVRLYLQHVERVLLQTPQQQRHPPPSWDRLNTGLIFRVLLTVRHLVVTDEKTDKNQHEARKQQIQKWTDIKTVFDL